MMRGPFSGIPVVGVFGGTPLLLRTLYLQVERVAADGASVLGIRQTRKRLGAHGVKAGAMHGNKSQRQREQALSRFRSGAADTLVAIDVAARGIYVDGISHVINFDPPGDSETYVHRVGRTGRTGRTGIGITLLKADQHRDVTQLAGQLGLDHGLSNPHSRSFKPGSAPHAGPRSWGTSRRRRPPRTATRA